MAESDRFYAELARRLNLAPSGEQFFRAAGVRSFEAAHNLLLASFAADVGDLSPAADRRSVLARSLEPLLSATYRMAVDEWLADERYPAGAAAPSPAALSVMVPMAAAHLLDPPTLLAVQHELPPLSQAAAIDLVGPRYNDWQIEDQRPRATCVAFAVTACIELLRAGQATVFTLLSPQFLYWHMRKHAWPEPLPPGWTDGATKLGFARQMLAEDGICNLALCEYPRQLPPTSGLEGPRPTDDAEADALANRIASGWYLDCPDPDNRPANVAERVYDLLEQRRPVAIAVPIFARTPGSSWTTFDNPQTLALGEVCDPPPGATVSSGHAVCVIGFQPDAGGGWFIFRNSFGPRWPKHVDPAERTPPVIPAPGYGAISARYVEKYCWELFSPKVI